MSKVSVDVRWSHLVCVCVSLSLSLYLSIYLSLFSQALKSLKQVTTLRGWFSLPRHSWPCCHANPRTRLMLCFLKLLFGMTEKQCQHPRMNSQELGATWSNASRNRRNSHSLVLSFSLKDSNAVTRLHCGVILTEKRTTGKAYKRIHTQISVDRIYIYIWYQVYLTSLFDSMHRLKVYRVYRLLRALGTHREWHFTGA